MSTPTEIYINGKKHISAQIAFTGWSVSKGVLYDEFNAKEIKGVKIGRAYYVDEEAFLEYCEERGYTRKPIKQAEVKEASIDIKLEALRQAFDALVELLRRDGLFNRDLPPIDVEPVQASLLSEEAA